jgi:hypothetical protein
VASHGLHWVQRWAKIQDEDYSEYAARRFLRHGRLFCLAVMSQLFRFPRALKRDPAVEVWTREHADAVGGIAQRWFEVMRVCGHDVRELLHDGHPTACVGDAAFAYVDAFKAHVNVGFFRGAEMVDPKGSGLNICGCRARGSRAR